MSRTGVALQFATFALFPNPGADSILYIATDTNSIYRWTGSIYVLVGDGGGGGGSFWSQSTGFLYPTTLTDYVGIGTATPEKILHTLAPDGGTPVAPSSVVASLHAEVLSNVVSGVAYLIYGPQDSASVSAMQNYTYTGYIAAGQTINYQVLSYIVDISGARTSPLGVTTSFTDTTPLPLDNSIDNGSVENPAYTGYVNNDIVSARVYQYRLIGGIYYASPIGVPIATLGPLANNPAGIDWNWTAGTMSDSNPPDGYILEITDATTSTVYSYDVGTALTYADNNTGGTVSYVTTGIPFGIDLTWPAALTGDGGAVTGYVVVVNADPSHTYDVGNVLLYADVNAGGTFSYTTFTSPFTAMGQTFTYDIYNPDPTSPISGTPYYSKGVQYTVTDVQNNGTLVWISHVISPVGGVANYKIIDILNGGGLQNPVSVSGFTQRDYFFGDTTCTPNHYGFLSDGTALARTGKLYSYRGGYYSDTPTLSNTLADPNDGQYYTLQYDFTYTSPITDGRLFNDINGGGYTGLAFLTGVTTFAQDVFTVPDTTSTVTPNTFAGGAVAGLFENTAGDLDISLNPQLILRGQGWEELALYNASTKVGSFAVNSLNNIVIKAANGANLIGLNIDNPQYNVDAYGSLNITGDYYKNGVLQPVSPFVTDGNNIWSTDTTAPTGGANFLAGYQAGNSMNGGTYNVFVGYQAGKNTTSGSNNFGFGIQTLTGNTTGSGNLGIGSSAGSSLTSGDNNVFLGTGAGGDSTKTSHSIFLGLNANNAGNTDDGVMSIGNLLYGVGMDGIHSTISSGGIGIRIPDPSERFEVNGNVFLGGDVSVLDRTSLGAEKITNGTFTGSATSWTLGTGWAYSSNTVTKNANGTGTLSQTSAAMVTPLVVGEYYILSYNLNNVTAGTVTPSIAGVTLKTRSSGQNSITQVFRALSTASLVFTPTNTSRFIIDNVSLKKITAGSLYVVKDEIINGDLKLATAGSGLYVKEGTNATMGTATLTGGTVTVNTTKVTANSRIFLTVNGGTLTNIGSTYISARTAGTSFAITSTNILDASNVAWLIVEPA